MKTEQQMKNLREALVWWQSVPKKNVAKALCEYTKGDTDKTDCKTVACFGGWCARWPELKAQGLSLSADGYPENYLTSYGPELAHVYFGDYHLWKGRGGHAADQAFEGSDHALVTNRIRWALEH